MHSVVPRSIASKVPSYIALQASAHMEQLPVKLWDTASGVPYFLLVKFCANEADFERSTFDIEATDGTVRWSVEGQNFSL